MNRREAARSAYALYKQLRNGQTDAQQSQRTEPGSQGHPRQASGPGVDTGARVVLDPANPDAPEAELRALAPRSHTRRRWDGNESPRLSGRR